ncbi:disease resistance protein RGA2-like [Nymphaea colorata]|uniref:NB-ARC domain-containing protein n=1 Tax=Nymphaea colorata TaxID=210225 RepID=A0A5K0V003_9MAGN|nr:disease resistance protein RGA2-like [Nymphaea colorata]
MAMVIDTLAETAISNLLGAVTSLLKEKVDLIWNAKDDLKRLNWKLEKLQKDLKTLDRKHFFSNERDKDLENEVKDILYDAQDIIEEYQNVVDLSKREKDSMTSLNKVRKPWIILCSCFKEHVSASYQLGNEIKNINRRLDEIGNDSKMVDLLNTTRKESSGKGPIGDEHNNPRETTHYISTTQPPIGRANDKEKVKELLFDGFTENSVLGRRGVSIVSIVGQGGIGKTTLAKMVFKEAEEQFGKHRWWVCVSEMRKPEDFLQKIVKEVCKGSERELEGTTLSALRTQLESELSKSKFLLVLDDMWELGWWKGEVEDTLMGGAKESKIVITSRKVEVSQGIGAKMHKLPAMTFEESWCLFLDVAWKEENELATHNLKGIGERIVAKCGGLPLVVETVGSLMRTKRMTKAVWESVEKSEIWEWKMPASSPSSEIYGSILPGLMLSYDDLSHDLKRCFVYCCIYPKDYEIEKGRLVKQWVAHGLIDQKKGIDVEETANENIDNLIYRCLFEETEDKKIKLHDILHDLASYIGEKEYRHASATEQTRHLSLLGVDDAEAAMKYNALGAGNKVRTLLSNSLSSVEFTNFKWLRVLSLMGCQMDKLPNSIECLSLLKYLDLSESNVRQLPSSIGKLHNLQTLDLSNSNIEELPEEMGELCNLRYLGLKGTECLTFMAEGVGKLTNLRTLHRFLVCDEKGDTRGCNIRELKDLNKLKGELLIKGLGGGRVKVIDAKKAQLKEKHELNIVALVFKNDKVDSASDQRSLLEALEPPHGIERLGICDYEGDRPAWYLDTNYVELRTLELRRCPLLATIIGIKSLEKLEVDICPTLCELPSMLFLKSLVVEGCNMLKTLANMPALESLKVAACGSLEQVAEMPALRSLRVVRCNMLKTLANMPALESLEVRYCDSIEQITEMPALRSLSVYRCNMLKTLANMLALDSLNVSFCDSLEQVTEMPALRSLEVGRCNMLKTFANMPALESLEVRDCGSLEQVAEMPALKSLKLDGCNGLKTLATMPALELLQVEDCNALKQLPTRLASLKIMKMEKLANWKGWPAAGSGETTFTSMPCLRVAFFSNCPMMQTEGLIYALSELAGHDGQATQLQELTVWDCPNASLGWKLLQHLPNLNELALGGTVLESIVVPSEVSTILPSLKNLILMDNNSGDLKWGKVPDWVWALSQLEELGLRCFTEDISLGGHWQCLPKLKSLWLWDFPNLKSLVDVNNITPQQNETTCPTDAKQQITCLSKLEHLGVQRCPALDLPQELRDRLGGRLDIYE